MVHFLPQILVSRKFYLGYLLLYRLLLGTALDFSGKQIVSHFCLLSSYCWKFEV